MTKHTIVQHSAYGYGGDPTFARGLETRQLDTKAEIAKVEKAGGLVFDDYCEAEDFAMDAMYPPEATGFTPMAKGTFATVKIDGLAVYVPVRQVVG